MALVELFDCRLEVSALLALDEQLGDLCAAFHVLWTNFSHLALLGVTLGFDVRRAERIVWELALVLGLLIASAKTTYDTRSKQVLEISADIILLDRVLAHYGPATEPARAELRRSLATAIQVFWPADGEVEQKALNPGCRHAGRIRIRAP